MTEHKKSGWETLTKNDNLPELPFPPKVKIVLGAVVNGAAETAGACATGKTAQAVGNSDVAEQEQLGTAIKSANAVYEKLAEKAESPEERAAILKSFEKSQQGHGERAERMSRNRHVENAAGKTELAY